LIEDFSITKNPSASIMVKTASKAATKRGSNSEAFIGISNPRFNYKRFPGLPTLPSAEEEVARARDLYPESELIKNDQATESSLIHNIGHYEIVHLAGHILIDGQFPLQSSILLAEEPSRSLKERDRSEVTLDGTLQAVEIYQLKLPRTRLVILSGCQSAVGDYTRGEALSMLTQSFFAAGVPSVIASLWEVDDALSAEVMYSFHYNHRVKHQEFGEALSQALRSLIYETNSKRRHPYYWAAFLLSGSGLDNNASLN
jgi:CHAT domain-containing protein